MRIRIQYKHIVLLALVALFASTAGAGCKPSIDAPSPTDGGAVHDRAGADTSTKVVIFVIDGVRYSESFGDPTHTYMPRIWNELRPQGTLYENVRNTGTTSTIPGHTSLLSGTWQSLANDGSERPTMPTIFEYYRDHTGAPMSDAIVIGGKAKLAVCSYSTHAGYGSAVAATENVGYSADVDVAQQLMLSLQNDQPHLIMVSLSEVDTKAHSGVWEDYLAQITIADSIAADTWGYLQGDPFYAGHTYMFITGDHGRHDDASGGFKNHGDDCEGCQRLSFMALGPDVRAGQIVSTQLVYKQRDLCKTVGHVLGIDTPYAEGNVMNDMFEPTTTGIR